ncbi:hypothetical protein F5B21DRAFT_508198 [Xylaria acuta]|nr:hypothetical protein F5B21DRAFT_508198 [Xylaria acuta]
MKITISVLAIMATVLTSTSASPVAIKSATTTTPSTHDHSPPPYNSIEEMLAVVKPGSTLTVLKHQDHRKNKCQFDECKACVRFCSEESGFTCIYWQCMPTVCKYCNLKMVHPHPPDQ